MKSLLIACGLILGTLAVGCAGSEEEGGEPVDGTEAEVKSGVSRVTPGTFKLYAAPFHTINVGCDIHTALELKQTASGAVAILEERVGGMCLLALPPNHREYKLR